MQIPFVPVEIGTMPIIGFNALIDGDISPELEAIIDLDTFRTHAFGMLHKDNLVMVRSYPGFQDKIRHILFSINLIDPDAVEFV